MTKAQTKTARAQLRDYADRVETIGTEHGWAITAHWRDGGQQVFYTLDAVRERVREIATR